MGEELFPPVTEEVTQEGLKFVDDIFVAFLQQKNGMKGKPHWLAAVRRNEQYAKILDSRLNTSSRRLAESMDISLGELYRLEQEIFQSYYSDFHGWARRG